MVSPEDIRQANKRIGRYVRETPVVTLEAGSLCDVPVTLKLEHMQHSGSFKCRGAFNTLLSYDVPDAGVVAVSGGNHGAAVAYAALQLGYTATVFVPDYASAVKMERMRGFGANVIPSGNDFQAVIDKFEAFSTDTGALAVHPFDAHEVLAGQGTVALEFERQVPDLDTVIVSVGGGGLVGGVSSWFGPRVNVVAVESEGTATYATALQLGKDVMITPEGISADSLGAPRLGALAYTALTTEQRPSILVNDAHIITAQQRLWETARIVAEPGAATALAALTSGAYRPEKDERVGVLVCGGNAAPDWFLTKETL